MVDGEDPLWWGNLSRVFRLLMRRKGFSGCLEIRLEMGHGEICIQEDRPLGRTLPELG